MIVAAHIARILLGFIFVMAGLNDFIHLSLLPLPPQGAAHDFMNALITSHYMNLVGGLQIWGGVQLLIGRWVPLALTILGPVIANILCFHIFMESQGLPMAVLLAALALFLFWRYRGHFAEIVKPSGLKRQHQG